MHNCRFSLTLFALASFVHERLGGLSLSALLQSQVFFLFWRGRPGEDEESRPSLCNYSSSSLFFFSSSTPFLASILRRRQNCSRSVLFNWLVSFSDEENLFIRFRNPLVLCAFILSRGSIATMAADWQVLAVPYTLPLCAVHNQSIYSIWIVQPILGSNLMLPIAPLSRNSMPTTHPSTRSCARPARATHLTASDVMRFVCAP